MNKNKWGYKKGSPYANQPYIDIQGNDITMVGVPHDILALPDNDKPTIMKPGKNYKFKNSKVVREIPLKQNTSYQHGGNFGLAGENTMPMSPFISLKPFINKYKLKYGGVIDYMSNLPEEQQYLFAEEFDDFDEVTQDEIADYLNGGYYQTGGSIPVQPSTKQGNAELEEGETLIDSSQKLKQVKGKKHSEGGEEMNLEGGTRIYSEHLKAPEEVVKQVLGKETKKKYSYADLSKKFPTQPSISILTDPNSDDYQKTTAQLTLANNLGKLDTIFYAQEKDKQGKEGNKFQKGGIKKYQVAGTFGGGEFGGSGSGLEFDWVTQSFVPVGQSILQYQATDRNRPFAFSETTQGGTRQQNPPTAGFQRARDWSNQFPVIHSEPSPTVTTGVVLNLRDPVIGLEEEYVPTVPTQPVMPERNEKVVSPVRGKQPVPKRKPNRTVPNPVTTNVEVGESDLWQVPLPLGQLPQRTYSNLAPTKNPVSTVPSVNEVADIIVSSDDQDYVPANKKWDWSKFGISPELAGTVADIGLALSDKLRVSEPTFYDRTKTPLFTRFVDFDDKEVQRMYDKNIQQIQQSNLPEQVKQAQISALTSNYQDYQAKVDYGNLQRYENKRERDTDKLQRYLDTNIDQRVADIESYRMKKARVDELRNSWRADRKSRIVNSLKQYANYADTISKSNEFTDNYKVNPITGKINFKESQKSNLTDNLLQQYAKTSNNKIDLGGGTTARIVGDVLIITDNQGKVTTEKITQQ